MKFWENPMTTARRDTPSFGTRGFLFALILTFIFYLLVSEMVTHHFFSGGAPDSPKTLPSFTPFGSGPALLEPHQTSMIALQPGFLLKLRSSNWPLVGLDVSNDETVSLAGVSAFRVGDMALSGV